MNNKEYECNLCRDTGERAVKDHNFSDGYAIIHCSCPKGREAASDQAEVLSDL